MSTAFHDFKLFGVEEVNTSLPVVTAAQKVVEGQEIARMASSVLATSLEAGHDDGEALVGEDKVET